MRPIFFAMNRPRHFYKSAGFFQTYFHLRHHNLFGSSEGRDSSHYKKILMLRKFFIWYYQLPNKSFLKKLVYKTFVRKRMTFRRLTSFFHLLEQNLLISLVRGGLCFNLIEAVTIFRAGFVFVNGSKITIPYYVLRVGDIIEILNWQRYFFIWTNSVLFMCEELQQLKQWYITFQTTFFFLNYKLFNCFITDSLKSKIFQKKKKFFLI